MRFKLLFVLVLLSLVTISGQTVDPGSKKNGAPDETNIRILQPDASDIELAAKQGLHVFKIIPREMMDFENNEYGLRGGGAYYSFINRSHSYNRVPQIQLQQGELQTGFAGADYGFLTDVGKMDLTTVEGSMREVAFLQSYTPPKYEPEVREEKKKARNYVAEGITYKRRLEAVSGHTYVLRAILFDEGDSLVAFNINRINPDGSMVIFWKPLQQFKTPVLLYHKDSEIKAKVDAILKDPNYARVSGVVTDNVITLSGEVGKDHYSNLIQAVSQAGPRLNNQVVRKDGK